MTTPCPAATPLCIEPGDCVACEGDGFRCNGGTRERCQDNAWKAAACAEGGCNPAMPATCPVVVPACPTPPLRCKAGGDVRARESCAAGVWSDSEACPPGEVCTAGGACAVSSAPPSN